MKRISLFFFCLILFGSCHESNSNEIKSPQLEASKEQQVRDGGGTGLTNYTTPTVSENQKPIKSSTLKLIKRADLVLKTKTITKAKLFIDQILAKNKGYYGNESYDKTDYEASYNLTIRVPSTNFETTIAQLGNGPTELVSKTLNAKDVGEDYADTEARIVSKRAYLKRYQELLGKAKNVTELMEMEEQIRQLIEEIEAAESKLKHYDNYIAYSEITIRLFQTFKVPKHVDLDEPGFWSQLGDSFATGWHGVERFIIGFFSAWPSLLVFAALLYFFRKPIRQFLLIIQGKKVD